MQRVSGSGAAFLPAGPHSAEHQDAPFRAAAPQRHFLSVSVHPLTWVLAGDAELSCFKLKKKKVCVCVYYIYAYYRKSYKY